MWPLGRGGKRQRCDRCAVGAGEGAVSRAGRGRAWATVVYARAGPVSDAVVVVAPECAAAAARPAREPPRGGGQRALALSQGSARSRGRRGVGVGDVAVAVSRAGPGGESSVAHSKRSTSTGCSAAQRRSVTASKATRLVWSGLVRSRLVAAAGWRPSGSRTLGGGHVQNYGHGTSVSAHAARPAISRGLPGVSEMTTCVHAAAGLSTLVGTQAFEWWLGLIPAASDWGGCMDYEKGHRGRHGQQLHWHLLDSVHSMQPASVCQCVHALSPLLRILNNTDNPYNVLCWHRPPSPSTPGLQHRRPLRSPSKLRPAAWQRLT
ncbi:hypothetical protein T440DRAFT_224212 [Plenodomus tracheiphilus IPT5]|uniref:Uncharacterized protein n=1 Tax=Plenodomus tracheiphilus IPT5 TaxID=1408161 RepID=A0A6A7AU63_9PLEO|nr:hypothetical protein T440DRAFT_224212 [Plenodomus tracheiphilus IPT5]